MSRLIDPTTGRPWTDGGITYETAKEIRERKQTPPSPPPPPDFEKTPPRLIDYHADLSIARWKLWSAFWSAMGALAALEQFTRSIPR
jgi:hypothetical protein